ncbi:hypothetical protein [Providencia burhodogranariea]|uniref:hypothetical protein n=1 Tax=Providencia burhodogranariea TaxID=516074 RepID=UPI0011D2513A
MFNLTLHPRFCQVSGHFCRTMKGKIRLLSRSMSVDCCFSSLMLVNSNVQANYAPMIQNPRDVYKTEISSQL